MARARRRVLQDCAAPDYHPGRDAELRHTQIGKPVSSIRLDTNRQIKGGEETQFHTIVCWDRLVETTATYVKKGNPFYIEGRLQYRSFQDEEGKERGVAQIVAADVQFLSRRSNGRRGEPEDESSPSPLPTAGYEAGRPSRQSS